MNVKLNINSLFVYSEKNDLFFYSNFSSYVNIFTGRNTSGKSSIFQAILFSFGINDVKGQLHEILEEDVIFRVDCTLERDQGKESLMLIRDDEIIYVKVGIQPIKIFSGISGDSSAEHIKLKAYISEIMGFDLYLESKNEYKPAPIEVMFLPYYISQSFGWIYLRKSFSSLDFYRNFKNDYLDYYLAIDDAQDRLDKQRLQEEIRQANEEILFFVNMENNNHDIQITKIVDEKYIEDSIKYIEKHKENYARITSDEKDYVIKCNELSYCQQRTSILSKVSRNHKNQNPKTGFCPSCSQVLPNNIESYYAYKQEENDTQSEIVKYKEKIKKVKSSINSLLKSIDKNKKQISIENKVLNESLNTNITYESWLNNKANVLLIDKITYKLGELEKKKLKSKIELDNYKSDLEIERSRLVKNKEFKAIFNGYQNELKVKKINEERYNDLYRISAFPTQGVELHKTILAYHFAFNKIIKGSENAHRLPFILDSIFNEDVEPVNKELIIEFISKKKPVDTQLFISIAEAKGKGETTDSYNKKYFNSKARVIPIGNLESERALLSQYDNERDDYLEETLNYIDNIE